MNSIPQKQCPRCKETYPATSEYFWSDKSTKDGLYSRCRKCGKGKVIKEVLPDGQKRCIGCKQVFPATLEYFDPRSGSEGNLRGECSNCRRIRLAKWRDDNHEHYIEYHKQYRSDNAEQVSAIKSDWFKRNKERVAPRMKITGKRWKENNRDKVRMSGRTSMARRKARIRAVGGTHTAADIELQFRSQKGKCWWCEKKLGKTYHVDHRIAISKGGTNWPNNICISCQHCNESKHNKMPWEWNGRLL
jgi:hypothetical protein